MMSGCALLGGESHAGLLSCDQAGRRVCASCTDDIDTRAEVFNAVSPPES